MTLTPKQLEVLQYLRRGYVLTFSRMSSRWAMLGGRSDFVPVIYDAAIALKASGLIEQSHERFPQCYYRLTELGRAAAARKWL